MGALAVGEKNKMLDALTGRATYTLEAGVFAKLHVGAPGTAGTSNAAGETTRQAVTFGTGAAAGAIASTAQVQWTSVSTGETYTHVSFWSAVSGGTFLGSDDLPTAKIVTVGDTFTIASGDISLAIND